LAFAADWPIAMGDVDDCYSAFVAPSGGAAGGVRIVVPAVQDANMGVGQVLFSTDGTRLYVRGDLIVNNDTEVFSTTDFATDDQDPTAIRVVQVPLNGDAWQLVAVP
jgi:hypothetical protein